MEDSALKNRMIPHAESGADPGIASERQQIKIQVGKPCANAIRPRKVDDLVNSNARYASAVVCIHVPVIEINWPVNHRR
jgi:hypothetical protein